MNRAPASPPSAGPGPEEPRSTTTSEAFVRPRILGPEDETIADLTDAEVARRYARPPLLRRVPVSALEGLLTLLLFVPLPVWLAGGGTRSGGLLLLLGLIGAGAAGFLFRRLPTPLPSGAMLPGGLVWAVAVLTLPGGIAGMTSALLAGVVLVLYASVAAPDEVAPPTSAILAQAAVPAMGGALSLLVAASLLGVSAPLYSIVLVPTLGALALAVYLFGREDLPEEDASSTPGAKARSPAPPGPVASMERPADPLAPRAEH